MVLIFGGMPWPPVREAVPGITIQFKLSNSSKLLKSFKLLWVWRLKCFRSWKVPVDVDDHFLIIDWGSWKMFKLMSKSLSSRHYYINNWLRKLLWQLKMFKLLKSLMFSLIIDWGSCRDNGVSEILSDSGFKSSPTLGRKYDVSGLKRINY